MSRPVPAARRLRPLRVAGSLVLVPVAVYGAALSYDSLYLAARQVFDAPVFGLNLAVGLPLVVDLLILGASLIYVDGARHGRPGAGWRLTAHAAVATTLILNALAARTPAEIPWHVVAPAVWSVLVELTAREMLQEWRAAEHAPTDKIPARLWLTAPTESLRTWLRMARRLEGEQAAARLDIGLQDAALIALHTAMAPHGRTGRRTRRTLAKLMRRGVLHPRAVLTPLGWNSTDQPRTDRTGTDQVGPATTAITPEELLHAALVHVLAPAGPEPQQDTAPAPAARRRSGRPPRRTEIRTPEPEPAPAAPAPAAASGDAGPEPAPSEPPVTDSKVIDLHRTPPRTDTTAPAADTTSARLQIARDLLRDESADDRVTWGTVQDHLRDRLGAHVSPRTASRVLTQARADLADHAPDDRAADDQAPDGQVRALEEAGAR